MGKTIVHLFAREGAKVAIHGLEFDSGKIKENGGEAIFIKGDIMDEETPRHLIKVVIDQWGRLDILVNSAGVIQSSVIGAVLKKSG